MKRFITTIACLISVSLVTSASYAAPQNLGVVKQEIVNYHDSGEYDREFKKVVTNALAYLKDHDKTPKEGAQKLAIVLDIDETSLSNYNDLKRLNFGGTQEEIRKCESKAKAKALPATLALYRYALSHNIAVVFITGRPIEEKDATIKNLKQEGFTTWDKIVFRDGAYKTMPAANYKTAMRKSLAQDGYHIILNMGDQVSDLAGGYSEKTYKLPNPFYFIA